MNLTKVAVLTLTILLAPLTAIAQDDVIYISALAADASGTGFLNSL